MQPSLTAHPDAATVVALLTAPSPALSTNQLAPIVYAEMRQLAASRLARDPAGVTLQPTELVHEAFLRLVGKGVGDTLRWDSKGHFFAAAALAMRRILIERARLARHANRAQADDTLTDFRTPDAQDPELRVDIEELDRAMTALAQADARRHEVVMLRFFAALPVNEVASIMMVSDITVKRDWAFARAWLLQRMHTAKRDTP